LTTERNRQKRVAVAMSGGVDSSVSAALLKEQGYDVIGITMQLWEKETSRGAEEEGSRPCCTLEDVFDAGRVANKLGIPFHVVDYREEFRKLVVDGFVGDYFRGLTPNPCIRCNQKVKFGVLLEKARALGADYLATGHYARLELDSAGMYQLLKGKDAGKDQSYFLFTLTREQMSQVLFPLGSLNKQEVRRLADQFELPVAKKGESQDICFVSNDDYVRFLETERGEGHLSGNIVDNSGRILGRHAGIYRYTVGQRKGLGIAWPHPLYVLGVDAGRREVLVGHRDELYSDGLFAGNVNWTIPAPDSPLDAVCKIRYRHNPVSCRISPLPGNRAEVRFQGREKSVTPGQAVVFYDGDRLIGGGWIEKQTQGIGHRAKG
jgi:tRNA-specific 2-thiouridylase